MALPIKRNASCELHLQGRTWIVRPTCGARLTANGLATFIPKASNGALDEGFPCLNQETLPPRGRPFFHVSDLPGSVHQRGPHLQLQNMLARIMFARISSGPFAFRQPNPLKASLATAVLLLQRCVVTQ
ncbi:hypothetical protein PMIN06_003158 [Paraphaeosphaeria minitans]